MNEIMMSKFSYFSLLRQFVSGSISYAKHVQQHLAREMFVIAYHVCDLQLLVIHSFVAKNVGQSVQTYFSLRLTPPTRNKEIWLARKTNSMW